MIERCREIDRVIKKKRERNRPSRPLLLQQYTSFEGSDCTEVRVARGALCVIASDAVKDGSISATYSQPGKLDVRRPPESDTNHFIGSSFEIENRPPIDSRGRQVANGAATSPWELGALFSIRQPPGSWRFIRRLPSHVITIQTLSVDGVVF